MDALRALPQSAMIVPVQCSCGVCPEWVMVELQGHVDVQWPDGHCSSQDDGHQLVEIGTLRCTKPVRSWTHKAAAEEGCL